ncbi:alpha/beta fold hydrolase [Tenacibaculum amylolyticum]|uniref:alpha/beta fold hydrolase n=1 Tax=Tenacibaculum amylolyticum TaxID=104269 RepID=UPI0038930BA1
MENSIEYKKAKVSYECYGTGENTLVLLHGFLENSTMWKTVVETFSNTHKIICVDLLGHGKSECVGYVHTMEEIAESVRTVVVAEKVSKLTLIGHSMGGYVALAYAEKYPETIEKLCLLNSTSQADSEERKTIRTRAIAMAKTNYTALVSMSINNLFASETHTRFKPQIEENKKEALQTPVQGYIACTEGMKQRINREEVLISADFEKLIIAGEKDPVLSYNSIKKESERTKTKLVTLSNGHMSHIENTAEVLEALRNFLTS